MPKKREISGIGDYARDVGRCPAGLAVAVAVVLPAYLDQRVGVAAGSCSEALHAVAQIAAGDQAQAVRFRRVFNADDGVGHLKAVTSDKNINSKFEYRNPKQIQSTKVQNSKQRKVVASLGKEAGTI